MAQLVKKISQRIDMDEVPWKPSGRRPHSANGISGETESLPLSSIMGKKYSLKSESINHEPLASSKLDFTDKLRALRELIAAAKIQENSRQHSSNRIMVKRASSSLIEAREVGEKLQFTVNSFEKRELSDNALNLGAVAATEVEGETGISDSVKIRNSPTSGGIYGKEYSDYSHYIESEQILNTRNQKSYIPRPHSSAESYSHLLSRDLKQMSLSLEEDWIALERSLASSPNPKRVTFKAGSNGIMEERRSISSLGHYHYEVPERDWNIPTRTLGSNSENLHKAFPERQEEDEGEGPYRLDSLLHDPSSVLSESDQKGEELVSKKKDIYSRYSHSIVDVSTSLPEHDCLSVQSTRKPVQTNVKISDKLLLMSNQSGSATEPKRTVSTKGKASPLHLEEYKGEGCHWTQLLSQQRDRNGSRSAPSSPTVMHSNIPYAFSQSQPTSPSTFLIHQATKQLDFDNHQLKTASRKQSKCNNMDNDQLTLTSGEFVCTSEQRPEDVEVAGIFKDTKTRKKIIVKREQGRAVQESKASTKPSSLQNKPKSQRAHQVHSSQDSDCNIGMTSNPYIAKDDHIMTLDKLRALLRNRRSESRPSSQASSASMSSPLPVKAFHVSMQPSSYDQHENNVHKENSWSETFAGDSEKLENRGSEPALPNQRKVIKRPLGFSRSREHFQKSTCQSSAVVEGQGRILSSSSVMKPTRDKSSSKQSSSSSVKGLVRHPNDTTGNKKRISSSNKSGILAQSSTDFTQTIRGETANTLASAQLLCNNVQRLHHEICVRISRSDYLVRDLISKGHGVDTMPGVHHNFMISSDSGQKNLHSVRSSSSDVTSAPRSQSCIPLGKTLGAGIVDTENISSDLPAFGNASVRHKYLLNDRNTKEENDERSFFQHVQVLSKDLGTSTPKLQKHTHPVVSMQDNGDFDSEVRDSFSQGSELFPESLSFSSSRCHRRPVSVAEIPTRPGRKNDREADVLGWSSWKPTESPLSGGNTADVILSQLGNKNMVQLLQQLYTADDATRQAIITKGQFFKQWQATVYSRKRQRQIYSESLHRAQRHLITRLQQNCFLHWKISAQEKHKRRMADDIHRHHMLKKGLQAFTWAIMRSKHQNRTFNMRVSTIRLKASFNKWHAKSSTRRQQRMQTVFLRWQEYTYEEKSVHKIQAKQNRQLLLQTLAAWKTAYDRHMKENIADSHLRRKSLQQTWQIWCNYTLTSKQRAQKTALALNLCKNSRQRCTFYIWRSSLSQFRQAGQHLRLRMMQRVLRAWQLGAQVSHEERQHDLVTSIQHWHCATLSHTFFRWYQRLRLCRAIALVNKTLSRKVFRHWKILWEAAIQRRQEIEETIVRRHVHKWLLTWRWNVIDRLRKQKKGVMLIETCLMRGTMLSWRRYAVYKRGCRMSLQWCAKMLQHAELSRCFHKWKDLLHLRLSARHKQELWSLSCVRKMSAHWRHICHLRILSSLLEGSEPARELGLLRRMFGQWLEAKVLADEETAEVATGRQTLQHCQLQRCFEDWRLAAQRALTIRPLILRQQSLLVTWCFDAWRAYVAKKVEGQRCVKLFEKGLMTQTFTRWRRQFHCEQVSRAAQQNFMHRLARYLLQEWKEILRRKHQAQKFHGHTLLRHSFEHWCSRTTSQLREKAEEQSEKEWSQEVKRYYFSSWWSGVLAQIADNCNAISWLQERQNDNLIRSSFSRWRWSLHAHTISRTHQHTATQRLLSSVFLAWREATSQSLGSAVQLFVQQLGLHHQPQKSRDASSGESIRVDGHGPEFGDLLELDEGCHLDSTYVFSTRSEKWMSASAESAVYGHYNLDRLSPFRPGLLEIPEEQQNKQKCLLEMTVTFLNGLSHWPLSLVFSHWLDYTKQQEHLRRLTHEVKEKHQALLVAQAFQLWKRCYANSQKATNLINWRLQHNSLKTLFLYSRHRKVKAELAERARGHQVKSVLGKLFPWWYAKAEKHKHQRTVLQLWTAATPREEELFPLEMLLSRQMKLHGLQACLHVWRVRFLFLIKLKRVYQEQLQRRVLTCWHQWGSLRQHERKKGNSFHQARCTRLAFRAWCKRLYQKKETENRHQTILRNFLHMIFCGWRERAHVSKEHRCSRLQLECHVHLTLVRIHFLTWRWHAQLVYKTRTMRQINLLRCAFNGWYQAIQEGKQLRQAVSSFQAVSALRWVGHLFHYWRQHYHQQQQLHERQEEQAKQSALRCGKRWLRKAQSTRGRKLIVTLKYRKLSKWFCLWRLSLMRVEKLKQCLADHVVQKGKEQLLSVFGEWRRTLQSKVLERKFVRKLLLKFLLAWQRYARASRERHIRGQALQQALQERNLRLYFVRWSHLSSRVRCLQNNVEARLQLRVLQAWCYTVRRRNSQRHLGEKFSRLRLHRQMTSAFMTLRSRFDYCQGLVETADSVCAKRDRLFIRQAMDKWKDAVNSLLAQKFYVHLLSVRSSRKWLDFVERVKTERQRNAEQENRAVRHHNRKICHTVLVALQQEVKVKYHLQRRQYRISLKFAARWQQITEMTVTADTLDNERLYKKFWRCWRLAWVQRRAIDREATLQRRQTLSQIFTSWRSICPSHALLDTQFNTPSQGHSSPIVPRSFLPVPVDNARRFTLDFNHH